MQLAVVWERGRGPGPLAQHASLLYRIHTFPMQTDG